jgi:hypothetical protein
MTERLDKSRSVLLNSLRPGMQFLQKKCEKCLSNGRNSLAFPFTSPG